MRWGHDGPLEEGHARAAPPHGAAERWRSGAWLADNTIVYFAESSALKRLSADGGPAVALRGFIGAKAVGSIAPVPGNKGVLLTVCPANCGIASSVYVYSFKTDSLPLLVPRAAGAWYSITGQLLYTARDGGLYAVDFDAQKLTLTSGPVSVIERVDPLRFAMSASGAAVYTIDEAARTLNELVWVSRDGRETVFDSSWVEHFEYPALSPDGQSLAVSVRAKTTDLWLRRPDGTRQRLATPGAVSWRPSWAPDGKSTGIRVRWRHHEESRRCGGVSRARRRQCACHAGALRHIVSGRAGQVCRVARRRYGAQMVAKRPRTVLRERRHVKGRGRSGRPNVRAWKSSHTRPAFAARATASSTTCRPMASALS